MQKKSTSIIIILLLIIIAILLYNNFNHRGAVNTPKTTNETIDKSAIKTDAQSIDKLTRESVVVPYVKQNNKLPDYYITKRGARERGWVASEENLCEVLPGRAIGGDIFSNRERQLPYKKGRIYYEADLNYNCGNRNADRLIFSNDGLIFVTYNHYKTFEKR
ncbi:MAG: ribonuclease domain-containing protein [Paludibacteraceae bacterium]